MADVVVDDPLGRSISLPDRTWFGHIMKGHPEVARYRDEVIATLAQPDLIAFSSSDDDCRLYVAALATRALQIVVVADVVQGMVKTAYLAKRMKPGEIEWSRPTH